MDYEDFLRKRLISLMDQDGISAYSLSAILGHGKNYITQILAGEYLPKFKDFVLICDYFGITPKEFFDDEVQNPRMIKKILGCINRLGEDELEIILPLLKRLESDTVSRF